MGNRTLVIAPHMDDESISAGGLIADRIDVGGRVHVLVLSGRVYDYGNESEEDSFASEKDDFMKAISYLSDGSTRLTASLHNLPEGEPTSQKYYHVLKIIEGALKDFDPTEVVIPGRNDLNQDHRFYNELCRIALRPANLGNVAKILEMRAMDSEAREASYYVPITYAILSRKLAAVASYGRERREAPHPRAPSNILSQHRIWGSKVGAALAEAYDLILYREV